MIPAAGIKVYGAISQAMIGNPQTYPAPEPQLLAKFASIGMVLVKHHPKRLR
jgi:hypothetical protein